MAQEIITLGSGPDTPGGDTRYAAFNKAKNNFAELYGHVSVVKPPYRPENYGAKFDGATNDTAAWTSMFSAINTAGGGEVVVPPGTSRATTLAVPSKCAIRGAGRDVSTVRRLSGTAPLITLDGTDINTRCTRSSVEGIGFHGNDLDGPLFRTVHSGLHTVRDVTFNSCLGPAMQFVECWDSRFDNIYAQNCGRSGSISSSTGAPTGGEVIQIWGGLAATGFGASADSNNLLTFSHLHVETFKSPALSIQRGLGTAATANYGVRFLSSKFESGSSGQYASQYMVVLGGFGHTFHFHNCYFTILEQTNAAYASTTRFVDTIADGGAVFRDCWTYNAVGMDYAFRQWTGGRVFYESILHTGTLPTGASVYVQGGSAPYINEVNAIGTVGGVTPRFPVA